MCVHVASKVKSFFDQINSNVTVFSHSARISNQISK